MNILMISRDSTLLAHDASRSGDSFQRHKHYAELVAKLTGQDACLHIVCPRHRNGSKFIVECGNLKIHPAFTPFRALFFFDVLLIGVRLLSSKRFFTVTTQTADEDGLAGWLLAKLFGLKLVVQIHFDVFSKEWRSEKLLHRVIYHLSGWVARKAAIVRVVSPIIARKMQAVWGIAEDKIQTIPVGVSMQEKGSGLEALTQNPLHEALIAAEKMPSVLFVGRLVRGKNLRLWLEVAKSVSIAIPAALFFIAGEGDEKADLMDYAKTLGIEEKCFFLGNVTYEHLPMLYKSVKVFLLTSSHEAFGRVIVESFLCRTPVVAVRSTGPASIIEHGETGFLIENGDTSGLAEKVVSLLTDEGLLSQISQRAYMTAVQNYEFSSLARKWVGSWI